MLTNTLFTSGYLMPLFCLKCLLLESENKYDTQNILNAVWSVTVMYEFLHLKFYVDFTNELFKSESTDHITVFYLDSFMCRFVSFSLFIKIERAIR